MTDANLVIAPGFDYSAIENAPLADSTKAQYTKAVRHYLATGNSLADAQALAEYAQGLNKSSRAFLKAAVRLLTEGIAIAMKGGATPENVDQVQAGLYRLEAIQAAIKVKSSKGTKAHIWLSQRQVREIMATCDDGLVGQRDWIVLGLLLGAGLRREELARLTFDALKEVPRRNGHGKMRTVLEVQGKGAKDRVIPISDTLGQRIREWNRVVGDGLVARSLGRKVEIGESLSTIGVFNIVRKHGAMVGRPELAPHDCRRTYAQLGYDAGVPITQISKLLGHADVATTQRYLDLDLDLESTVSDFIPLE